MTTTPPTATATAADPDDFRMTMGEHLEELRRRILFGLIGVAVAAAGCFLFGDQLLILFCKPLTDQLQHDNLNSQFVYTELSEGFGIYIKVCLICAATVASPWAVYQLWLFVAAGLYPHERKYITRYIPLSVGLIVAGVLFVYYIVLPWTIVFFLHWSNTIPLPGAAAAHPATTMPAVASLVHVPLLDGDPPAPDKGLLWFNSAQSRLKLYLGKGADGQDDFRVIQFGSANLLTPQLKLPEYIDLVLTTLLTFGLCFQLPLVVLAVTRIGIVEVATLRSGRRYVYFGLVVLAATMTPGDVITAMVALTVPLVLLYELGIGLSVWNAPAAE